MYIQGNVKQLESIKRVDYRITDTLKQSFEPENALTVEQKTTRIDDGYDGFPVVIHQKYAGYSITAEVHLADGTKQSIGPVTIEAFDQ